MERTNVTDKGFTYNGQNFSKEARVDSQGQSYSVDVPNAISAQSLMGGQQAPIVPVTPNVPDISGLGNGANAYITQESAASDIAAQNEITARNEYQKLSGNQASLQALLGGESADKVQAMRDTGATELAGKLRQFSAQSSALQSDNLAKMLSEQNKATGQNITSTAVSRNTADATRQNTIDIAGLAMKSAIAKADYDTAKDYAEQIVTAKYDKIKAEIEAAKTNLLALDKVVLTPAENRAKEARLAVIKKQDEENEKKKTAELRTYTEMIDNKKEVSKMMVEAGQNAPASVLAKAKAIADGGGSAMAVAQALGEFGGDYMKNELLKSQLKTDIVQRSKIFSDIQVNNAQRNKLKAETNDLRPQTVTTFDSSGKPITTINQVNFKALTEGQGKDFTYAQRGDQANAIVASLEKDVSSMSRSKFLKSKLSSGNILTNKYADPKVQQITQAEKNFLTAVLRRESGAQIAPSEMEDGERIYFARPGDGDDVKAQKKQARETAINSFKANVPMYEQRVKASNPVSVEDNYLETALGAVQKVDSQVSNPVSNYRMMLNGLPGTKN